MGERFSRREALRIIGGTAVGLALGVGAGYSLGSATTPSERIITRTIERTATITERSITETGSKPSPGTVPQTPLKIGVVTLLSGPGAVGGVHVKNTAELVRDWINAEGGILGRKIEIVSVVDEAIGVSEVVKALRKMVTEDKVELIVGPEASGTGLGVAPVVENELHVVDIFTNATTTELFERVDPRPFYVFRAGNYDALECIAGARLAIKLWPDVKKIAGINPDYTFGRDEWKIFTTALKKLKPDIEIVYEAWPPLYSPDFTPHVTALDAAKPDLIFTSLWGGDLETFAKQAGPVGLFRKYRWVMSVGYWSYASLDKAWFPEGLLVGSRAYWPLYPPHWPLGERFLKEYISRFRTYPVNSAINTYMALYAYKLAVEKAYNALGKYPSQEDIVKFLEGLYVPAPSGYRFFRVEDHQGLGHAVYGVTKHSPDYRFPVLDPVYIFPPDEVAPPPGWKTLDWINSW